MKEPRGLTDLPFAGELRPLADALETDGDHELAHLSGSTLGGDGEAGIRAGYESLSGARIDNLQLMALAPYLARHLGITVDDA